MIVYQIKLTSKQINFLLFLDFQINLHKLNRFNQRLGKIILRIHLRKITNN